MVKFTITCKIILTKYSEPVTNNKALFFKMNEYF